MRFLFRILIILISFLFGSFNFIGNITQSKFLTILLLVYVTGELVLLYQNKKRYFFINPILLSSFVMFGLVLGGLSNWILFTENGFLLKSFSAPIADELHYLRRFMAYSCIAAACTWIGYDTNLGRKFNHIITKTLNYKKILGNRIDTNRLVILIAIAYLAKFYLFHIGLFGRITDDNYFKAGQGYQIGSQIRILAELSSLTYIVCTYLMFRFKNLKFKILFIISLLFELFFAFIYGARGPFLTPFIILFLVDYYVNNKVRVSYSLLIIPIFAAFSVIASFKAFTLNKDFQRKSNPIKLLMDYGDYISKVQQVSKFVDTKKVFQNIVHSTNFVSEGTMAIKHKDIIGLTDQDVQFKYWLVKSPIDGIIPLFLQPKKNAPAWGYWFKNKVLNWNTHLKYSIAMSPLGYAYLTGGLPMIVLIFLLYGILLRVCFEYLTFGFYGFCIFILILSKIYTFDVFSTNVTYIVRYIFIYPFVLFFLLKPFHKS